MKKNGFTLVEILAVIAIIAILATLVLPNIIDTFKKSKKNNFLTEAREVYKTAKNQYVYDRAKGFNSIKYQHGFNTYSGSDVKELDLNGRVDYNYLVVINTNGEIIYFIVQDNDYKVELGDNTTPVLLKDIK